MSELRSLLLPAAGTIYFFLGTLHLLYTFFTPKFEPYDSAVEAGMKQTNPKLTRRTTMWNAWIGFNGSHSTGAMFFGFMLVLAGTQYASLANSSIFQGAALLNSVFYVWLAHRYWFRIPFAGIVLSTLFVAAFVLISALD